MPARHETRFTLPLQPFVPLQPAKQPSCLPAEVLGAFCKFSLRDIGRSTNRTTPDISREELTNCTQVRNADMLNIAEANASSNNTLSIWLLQTLCSDVR